MLNPLSSPIPCVFGLVCCLALLQSPLVSAQEVQLEPNQSVHFLQREDIQKRIQNAGWDLVGEPLNTNHKTHTTWIWPATRGTQGVAISWVQTSSKTTLQSLKTSLKNTPDTSFCVDATTLLAVTSSGRPNTANILLNDLVTPPEDNTSKTFNTPLQSSKTPTSPLPHLQFRNLTRSELIHIARRTGWTPTTPPKTLSNPNYDTITYTLTPSAKNTASQPLTLSLYVCHTTPCTRQLLQTAQKHNAATLHDQHVVLVAISAKQPDRAKAFLRQLDRAVRAQTSKDAH